MTSSLDVRGLPDLMSTFTTGSRSGEHGVEPPPMLALHDAAPATPGAPPPPLTGQSSSKIGMPGMVSPSATLHSGDPTLAAIAAAAGAIDFGRSGGFSQKQQFPGFSPEPSSIPAAQETSKSTDESVNVQDAMLSTSQSIPRDEEGAMISAQAPTQPDRTWCDVLVDACRRCRPKHVRRACRAHHKILSLHDDTQNFVFCAPERASMLHVSLWINVTILTVLLGGLSPRRPHNDPYCVGFQDSLALADVGCLLPQSGVDRAAFSALMAMILGAGVQILCRGRSFAVRTAHLKPKRKDNAFRRHFLGKWPMCFYRTEEVWIWFWNTCVVGWYQAICGKIQCCKVSAMDKLKEKPLNWRPSLAPFFVAGVSFVLIWCAGYYAFFFSSSLYMWEVTHTDQPGKTEHVPPAHEQPEVAAAAENSLDWNRLLVPEMQRYIVLMLIAWFLQFFIFEPISLTLHLLIGEPSIDETKKFLKDTFVWLALVVPRLLWFILSTILQVFSEICGWILKRFPDSFQNRLRNCTATCQDFFRLCWDRLKACLPRRLFEKEEKAQVPAGLEETVESEEEDG